MPISSKIIEMAQTAKDTPHAVGRLGRPSASCGLVLTDPKSQDHELSNGLCPRLVRHHWARSRVAQNMVSPSEYFFGMKNYTQPLAAPCDSREAKTHHHDSAGWAWLGGVCVGSTQTRGAAYPRSLAHCNCENVRFPSEY